MDCLKLNRALTMDRMAGLQDLQDRFPRAKLGANYGQDYRMAGFTG